MLQVQGVFKSYATPQGPLAVLAGVDLHLAARSSLALMGESGSGKSTLLHLVAGLDRLDGTPTQIFHMDFTGCPPAVLYITGQVSPVGNLLVAHRATL